MKNLLPIALRKDEHYEAVAELIEEFVAIEDLEILVPLLIDSTPEQALLHLAEYLSVLGIEGWETVTTTEEKRLLLKEAILIHRTKGTPFAIKQALARALYDVVRIEEGTHNFTVPTARFIKKQPLKFNGKGKFNGVNTFGSGVSTLSPIKFNGAHKFDGSQKFGLSVNRGTGASLIAWAMFRVVFRVGNDEGFSAEQRERAVRIIEAFKNARSWLTDLLLLVENQDVLAIGNEITNVIASQSMRDSLGTAKQFDGSIKFNGAHKFAGAMADSVINEIFLTLEDSVTISETIIVT